MTGYRHTKDCPNGEGDRSNGLNSLCTLEPAPICTARQVAEGLVSRKLLELYRLIREVRRPWFRRNGVWLSIGPPADVK